MKSVLISIQRPHTDNIKALIKKIEVRKNKPNQETPFPCFIYETKTKGGCGKVIGEFVCDKVEEFHEYELSPSKKFYEFEKSRLDLFLKESCLSYNEVCDYRKNLPYYKPLYGWHISELKIYDKPKELSEFFTPMGKRPSYMVERPPQSWCYVEKLQEKQK